MMLQRISLSMRQLLLLGALALLAGALPAHASAL